MNHRKVCQDSPLKSFVKLPKLSGLPVQDNVETLERLMMGDYLYDRSRISLMDFLSFKSDKSPTREGRAALTDAFTNFQEVLVVYFGNSHNACFDDVLGILNEDNDILQDYNDSYIQIKFEMTISLFYHDVVKERTSLDYPVMWMATPPQRAALLKHYLFEELQRARGLSETNKWEEHPYSY
jgi:nucleoid DNA-binding protein